MCALLLLATVLLLPRTHTPPPSASTRATRRSGNEVLWQPPPPSTALFAAPGCRIHATDFFDASPSCLRCAGLPEERRFTRAALGRGYAVLAISSRAKCWSLNAGGEEGSELTAIESIIRWWTTEEFPKLAALPLVGIDASSDGYFLSALASSDFDNSARATSSEDNDAGPPMAPARAMRLGLVNASIASFLPHRERPPDWPLPEFKV